VRKVVRNEGDRPLQPEVAAQTNEFKQLRDFSLDILLLNLQGDVFLQVYARVDNETVDWTSVLPSSCASWS
jgi:hypothetical protein